MKFAIAFANTGPFINPDKAVAMAQAAEAAGFESLWTVELLLSLLIINRHIHIATPGKCQEETTPLFRIR